MVEALKSLAASGNRLTGELRAEFGTLHGDLDPERAEFVFSWCVHEVVRSRSFRLICISR